MNWLQRLFRSMDMERMTIASTLPVVAAQEIGVEEIDGTNCGPRVNEYKAATVLPPDQPWPWCAAFVCWCVMEAAALAGVRFTDTVRRPKTAGALDFERWSRAQDSSTWTRKPHEGDIRPGDIVIFTFSHIGIAETGPDADGFVMTIEGNTDGLGSREGGAVLRKRRHISKIRSRIRFRV
jgi:hypothetical protein